MERKTLTKFKRAYGTLTDAELATMFAISVEEVQSVAIEHSLGKDKKRFPGESVPHWTKEQKTQLAEIYATTPNEEIASILGRSVSSIMSQAYRLKLQKSKEHISEIGRENITARWGELGISKECA